MSTITKLLKEYSQIRISYEAIRKDASIEVAKNHIINELSWNQGLHNKLIDESIEALNTIGVNEGVNQGVNEGVN